jgi:hypothetical protein
MMIRFLEPENICLMSTLSHHWRRVINNDTFWQKMYYKYFGAAQFKSDLGWKVLFLKRRQSVEHMLRSAFKTESFVVNIDLQQEFYLSCKTIYPFCKLVADN